jgi:hypothetical protein
MHGLDFISKEIKQYLTTKSVDTDVWKDENLNEFSSRTGYAVSLIFQEKEIIIFSLLQWASIAIAYYIWVQILGWIPPEVWESDSKIFDFALNILFLVWSFICVAIAAYPIAIFTGAIGASHFLREQGYESTIAACLKLALPNSHKLWMYHTVDGWLTVEIILERLPKRGYFSNRTERLIKEALYYAWKVGTIGMPAALLTGSGLVEAGKKSISLVQYKLPDVIKLRGGYSVTCWIIGIATYVGSIYFFIKFDDLFESTHKIFTFYFWMGVPILISVGVIQLFIRPIYVIASSKLYSDYLNEKGEKINLEGLPSKGLSAFVAFCVLCIMVLTIYLYREQLGIMSILSVTG